MDLTYETLTIITIFIVPGFFAMLIVRKACPMRKHIYDYILDYLFLSLLNYVVTSTILSFIIDKWKITITSTNRYVLCFVVMLMLSIVFGIFYAKILQSSIFDRFLEMFNLKTIHSIPSAWEFYFSQQRPCFVVVKLKDDSLLAGLFGFHSFASSDMDNKDLYVEKAYRLVKKNKASIWEEDKESDGFYVNSNDIKSIEFLKYDLEGV